MAEPTPATLAHRLERLERENRWIRLGAAGILSAAVGVLLLTQTSAQAPIVEAQRFLVRDPKTGKERAALSLLKDGSVGLRLIGIDGKSLSLSADAGGNMGLTFYDKNRALRADVSASADGSSTISLRDASGKVVWKAP